MSAAWRTRVGHWRRLADIGPDLEHDLLNVDTSLSYASWQLRYHGPDLVGCAAAVESHRLDADGWRLDAELIETVTEDLVLTVPVLVTDGASQTMIKSGGHPLSVSLDGFALRVVVDGMTFLGDEEFGNETDGSESLECKDVTVSLEPP